MNSAADRINQRMSELKVSQADIKRATGAGKATISSWVNGSTKPSGEYASKLAAYLRCNTDWLLTGVGSMNNAPSERLTPLGTERVDVDHAMNGEVPVISWVAAGNWAEVMPTTLDDVIDWIPKPAHLSDMAFGLVVRGRSMWPEFKPDEIVYVEPNITPWDLKDGDLVIVQCNDDTEATFKQLVMGNGYDDMYLKPLNPDWPDQKMQPMTECNLVGVVDSKYTRYR
ncbi:helix-turn-helix domain-containing protein [Psychrobacter sp. FME13]|uniref:LexA family protein n=1 Tax=Psychrobacter sp. FME13 TaxID=2487708 RepID=UPI001787ADDF|nr:S24 family peptidase [Psychrobacter sp. FME13]MBE0440575.1 helix-turn-helix domain-containing protein [Psychrobacter sp. FME13]